MMLKRGVAALLCDRENFKDVFVGVWFSVGESDIIPYMRFIISCYCVGRSSLFGKHSFS